MTTTSPGLSLAAEDGVAGLFLAIEDMCRTAVLHHLGFHCGLLDNGRIRSQRTAQHAQAARGAVRVLHGADDLTVHGRSGVDPFLHGAVTRDGVHVQQAVATQLADDGGHAADAVEVLYVQRTGRRDARQVRGLLAYLVPIVHGHRAAGRVGDGRQVKHRVRGTAERHVQHHAVMDGMLVRSGRGP